MDWGWNVFRFCMYDIVVEDVVVVAPGVVFVLPTPLCGAVNVGGGGKDDIPDPPLALLLLWRWQMQRIKIIN